MSKGVTKDHVRQMLFEVRSDWENKYLLNFLITIATFYLNQEETTIEPHDFIDAILMNHYVDPYQYNDIAHSEPNQAILEQIAEDALRIHTRYKDAFNNLFTSLTENGILLTPSEQHQLLQDIIQANRRMYAHTRVEVNSSVMIISYLAQNDPEQLRKWMKMKRRILPDLEKIYLTSITIKKEDKFLEKYEGQTPQEPVFLKKFKSGHGLYQVGQDEVSWLHAYTALRDGIDLEEIMYILRDADLFERSTFYAIKDIKNNTVALLKYDSFSQALSVTNKSGERSLTATANYTSAIQEAIELIGQKHPIARFYGWENIIKNDQVLLADGSISQFEDINMNEIEAGINEKTIIYGKVFLDSLTEEQLRTLDTSNLHIVVSSKVTQNQFNLLRKARRVKVQRNNNITEIPSHLIVEQKLSIRNVKNLRAIPKGLTIGEELHIKDCHGLEKLPEGEVPYSIDVSFCDGLQIMPQMHIQGYLHLAMCDNLEKFTPGTTIDGALSIHHLKNLVGFPNDFQVNKVEFYRLDNSSFANFDIFTLPIGVHVTINRTQFTFTSELFQICRDNNIKNLDQLAKYKTNMQNDEI